jgi:uncharacterized membrane protein SirB2
MTMTLDYAMVKQVHVSAATVSIALFLLRGTWMLWSPERLRRTWVKVVPHVVDTVLLASALWLAWQVGVGGAPWLAAKVIALVVYIVAGTIALKRGRTRTERVGALLFAVATFAYIVTVAVTKSPWGALAWL